MKAATTQPELSAEIEALFSMVKDQAYPCLGAKAALAGKGINGFIAGAIDTEENDGAIVRFLYEFIDGVKKKDALSSAVVIFNEAPDLSEEDFDKHLWQRLQSFADIDAKAFAYDNRVSNDPGSPNFSFCLKEEALYVIGIHPQSARRARTFIRPAMVFNPHRQFERLRSSGKYDSMKRAIRSREMAYSGSVNPMLNDFGVASEAIQYSGRQYENEWKCPFVSRHKHTEDHPGPQRGSTPAE